MTSTEELDCPDVPFEGKQVPLCSVDVGVGEALNLCKHPSVKGVDCKELLQQYEAEQITAEQLMKTIESHSKHPDVRHNMNVIRDVVKDFG